MPSLDISECTDCCGGCDCDTLPENLTATIIAVTGDCGPLLGCEAAMTGGGGTWTGTFACGCGGNFTVTLNCISFEPGINISVDTSDPCPIGGTSIPVDEATCSPLSIIAEVTLGEFCPCCAAGGGTVTIEITE